MKGQQRQSRSQKHIKGDRRTQRGIVTYLDHVNPAGMGGMVPLTGSSGLLGRGGLRDCCLRSGTHCMKENELFERYGWKS